MKMIVNIHYALLTEAALFDLATIHYSSYHNEFGVRYCSRTMACVFYGYCQLGTDCKKIMASVWYRDYHTDASISVLTDILWYFPAMGSISRRESMRVQPWPSQISMASV